jgi:N-glycosidase YbiA
MDMTNGYPRSIGPCGFIYEPFGPLGILSNFALTPFRVDGETWPSTEHYFQAQKFVRDRDRERIRSSGLAVDAKRIAWGQLSARARPDWDNLRISAMRRALDSKFAQYGVARHTLVNTWPMPLVENSPSDEFWGIGADGAGADVMGNLLEEVRNELLGLRGAFEVAFPLSGIRRGGSSRIAWAPIVSFPGSYRRTLDADIVFDEFHDFSVDKAFLQTLKAKGLERFVNKEHVRRGLPLNQLITETSATSTTVSELCTVLSQIRAMVFQKKYRNYTWYQDARCATAGWVDRFYGVIAQHISDPFSDNDILVIGAGCGNEAAQVWNKFGNRATLADISDTFVENCRKEAPCAHVLKRNAEVLNGVADNSFNIYCALRVYESCFFDIEAALMEAWRVLRPKGNVVISISNAYLTTSGNLVRGHIKHDKVIDVFSPWESLIKASTTAAKIGFDDFAFADLDSELCCIAQKNV